MFRNVQKCSEIPIIYTTRAIMALLFVNTQGKGEIVRNEQFLLFPQCFLPF